MKGKWYRFRLKICKISGHRWEYFLHDLRYCRKCHQLQQWRENVPFFGNGRGWYTLVSRTKKGAKKFLNDNPRLK